ncbi:hypothetical protein EDC01DRAFT_337373 [Geopyxis carbonaria]|nr:hypothetical protein EDC01DRAFT_337373 [Geopyxis carbonaria]
MALKAKRFPIVPSVSTAADCSHATTVYGRYRQRPRITPRRSNTTSPPPHHPRLTTHHHYSSSACSINHPALTSRGRIERCPVSISTSGLSFHPTCDLHSTTAVAAVESIMYHVFYPGCKQGRTDPTGWLDCLPLGRRPDSTGSTCKQRVRTLRRDTKGGFESARS